MTHEFSFQHLLCFAFGGILLALGCYAGCKPLAPDYPNPPVIVESRCELPPKPVLPTAKAHRPSGGAAICFTPGEANKLRERDAVLKQWIREVLARCGRDAREAKDAGVD